jgi:hypothetical protein
MYSLFVDPRAESDNLERSLAAAGVDFERSGVGVVRIGGADLAVKEMSVVRQGDAALIAEGQQRSGVAPVLVVADRISAAARQRLSDADVAWLDRRGHLWIRAPGLYVNTDVPRTAAPPPPRVIEILSGTGFDVCLALLTAPAAIMGVNELARKIGRSPGRVSEILAALRREGLVESGNRPVVPELFWDVADRWRPRWIPLSSEPKPEPADRYRLSGTAGALALGAPVAAGKNWPQLYVADDADVAAISSAYGASGGWTAAEIAVCPSTYALSLAPTVSRGDFPVATAVVVAFDLAQDKARGREILEGWSPEGSLRVW